MGTPLKMMALIRIPGVILLLTLFSLGHLIIFSMKPEIKIRFCRLCSKVLLGILNIRIRVKGEFPKNNHLVIANHLSWLDPLLLLEMESLQFVTHQSVKNHPFLGWITRLGLCHFWNRSGSQLKQEIQSASLALNSHSLGIFPESTSHNGLQLLNFKTAPFEIALQAQVNICPTYIGYQTIDGESFGLNNHENVSYYGDMSFTQSLWNVLNNNETVVHLIIGETIDVQKFEDRKCLRDYAFGIFQKMHQEHGPYSAGSSSPVDTALHLPFRKFETRNQILRS